MRTTVRWCWSLYHTVCDRIARGNDATNCSAMVSIDEMAMKSCRGVLLVGKRHGQPIHGTGEDSSSVSQIEATSASSLDFSESIWRLLWAISLFKQTIIFHEINGASIRISTQIRTPFMKSEVPSEPLNISSLNVNVARLYSWLPSLEHLSYITCSISVTLAIFLRQ